MIKFFQKVLFFIIRTVKNILFYAYLLIEIFLNIELILKESKIYKQNFKMILGLNKYILDFTFYKKLKQNKWF
jgi:hypothetical protein